ncbi:MAG: helix-turn-helix domain-containing protein [Actinomycetota bacterium]|nr:helix-turn-helix domain-containing protein [Actinomycetota bacterium]
MRVAVHAFDGITMFHLAAPLLVFGELGRMDPPIQWPITVWTENGAGVRTAEGPRVEDVSGPEALHDADLLVFPSWPLDLPPADEALTARMRAAHDRGAQVAGLCLGAFPVVDSGLLDSRSAVTHWAVLAELDRRSPHVIVDHSALYLDHGDVLTSAGTASAIDACLHIVRNHLGASVATALSRRLVVAPHRDGDQAQYVDRPIAEPGGVGSLGPTLQWAMTHLDQNLTLSQLANHACMSRRNFTRRFAEATGTTPAKWVLARRLDESRHLLETTTWPVTRVAHACGFSSPVTFRQNFTAAYATTPTSYRQRFA